MCLYIVNLGRSACICKFWETMWLEQAAVKYRIDRYSCLFDTTSLGIKVCRYGWQVAGTNPSLLGATSNVMTRAETRFRLSAKRTSPFKSAGASVQSTTDSRGVRISGSNAGYTMFRGSEKGTGYPFHSRVSPSLPHPCVTVCHHISTAVYHHARWKPAVSYFVRGQLLSSTHFSLTWLFLGVTAKWMREFSRSAAHAEVIWLKTVLDLH
jgi:hypothetical protein